MGVRAKMRCVMVKESCDVVGHQGVVDVKLQAVYGGKDEKANASWAKWTPSGEVTLQITNPEASKQLELGKCYFVDLNPAEEAE